MYAGARGGSCVLVVSGGLVVSEEYLAFIYLNNKHHRNRLMRVTYSVLCAVGVAAAPAHRDNIPGSLTRFPDL